MTTLAKIRRTTNMYRKEVATLQASNAGISQSVSSLGASADAFKQQAERSKLLLTGTEQELARVKEINTVLEGVKTEHEAKISELEDKLSELVITAHSQVDSLAQSIQSHLPSLGESEVTDEFWQQFDAILRPVMRKVYVLKHEGADLRRCLTKAEKDVVELKQMLVPMSAIAGAMQQRYPDIYRGLLQDLFPQADAENSRAAVNAYHAKRAGC